MLRRCVKRLDWGSAVAARRRAQAAQFNEMHGWQRGEDQSFDEFVSDKRQENEFDEMDQRVTRGFNAALQQHKAEVVNGFKRRLTTSQGTYDPTVKRDIDAAIEERTSWLQDVWHQIDADYRSGDPQREARAAEQVSAALRGEASDYMAWAYDKHRERRFLGEKGKAEFDAEFADANLPNISEEEANRYHSLRLKTSEIERAVKKKYGAAGEDHWEVLQEEKDREYIEKLDRSEAQYKLLLKQQIEYDEDLATKAMRDRVVRVEKAKVRFKAAMDLEEERLKMVDAHRVMKQERREAERERHKQELRRAAELRQQGKQPAEVASQLKMERLNDVLERQNETMAAQRQAVSTKKRAYLDLIDEMEEAAEQREGANLMNLANDSQGRVAGSGEARSSVYRRAASMVEDRAKAGDTTGDHFTDSKHALWDAIQSEESTSPRATIHQARLDARKTYDDVYRMTMPFKMRLGSARQMKKNDGAFATAGNDKWIMKDPQKELNAMSWGLRVDDVRNLDLDPDNEYVMSHQMSIHRMDKRTGDADLRYEKKGRGGAIWAGPKFYKMGESDNELPPMVPPPKKKASKPDAKHPYTTF